MSRHLFSLLLLLLSSSLYAQTWSIEAEDPTSKVTWADGMADIIAPKGLTLWCNDLMQGNTIIEYEARILRDARFTTEQGAIRTSDLNCFWMASRKLGMKHPRFADYYRLEMYYMGFGGNWNTTTRFRRYNGDARGVDSAQYRPRILKEYTDTAHLLRPDDQWHQIRLEQVDGHVRYFIDGELLVDYVDIHPLTQGYFGFRTTLSHAQLRHFRYTCTQPDERPVVLHPLEGQACGPVTFGVPFAQGEVTTDHFELRTDKGEVLAFDTWRLASWPDGSSKWQAFAAVIPSGTDSCLLTKLQKPAKKGKNSGTAASRSSFAPLPDFSLTLNSHEQPQLTSAVEQEGEVRKVTKFTYPNAIVRAYQYAGSEEVKLVHTLLVDSALNSDGLSELSLHFPVAMHGKPYQRFVQFDDEHPLEVQPLVARRRIDLQAMDSITRFVLDNIAQWDGFRLSQLSSYGYTVRKRATAGSPWIGTLDGQRSQGIVCLTDTAQITTFQLDDFWESHPSTLQVDRARTDTAIVTLSLYSPEAEPYSFAHYDTVAHTLEAAYEDVQPGLSTAWGIARTSTIHISQQPLRTATEAGPSYGASLLPTPEYLHRKRAFGIWSLPTIEDERDADIEQTLSSVMEFYQTEIEKRCWYGFFNYGDVMHAYDTARDEWRYDVGGFAWDNTELGTPAMLWYQFLRTGDPKVWRMATAMTRHCSEVDSYHFGPHAGLGSRHNVTHWGCGAKESRISEAWWNRFMYYLTGGDERLGDIMDEVVASDTLLYTLDPMRLAQPRELYPSSAPARLRVGPDWLGYASNWFTAWEREDRLHDNDNSSNNYGKILAGMNSIAALPHGFYQGPLALGYDPATGIVSTDQPELWASNHLMQIMGGFELLCEMQLSIPHPTFYNVWLDHNRQYKEKAYEIKKSRLLIPRLTGHAGWMLGDEERKQTAWQDLLKHRPLPATWEETQQRPSVWTNDCATWTLDAIFLKEVIKR